MNQQCVIRPIVDNPNLMQINPKIVMCNRRTLNIYYNNIIFVIAFSLFNFFGSAHFTCAGLDGSYSVHSNWPQFPKGITLGQATGCAVSVENELFTS